MEKINEGGFGTIYKTKAGTIIKKFDKTRNKKASFIKEVNFLYLLKGYPHICQIIDCSPKDNTITLKLYAGNLKEFMDMYPLEKRTDFIKDKFVIDILAGLYYINSRGIIHGDIKPHNILYDKNFNFYYTDFGVSILNNCDSKYRIDNPNYKSFIATSYVCPETAYKQIYTDKSDLWAIGVIILDFLTSKTFISTASTYLYSEIATSYKVSNFKPTRDNIIKLIDDKTPYGLKLDNYKLSKVYKNLLEKIFKINPDNRIAVSDLKECIEVLKEKVDPIKFLPITKFIPDKQLKFIIDTLSKNKKDNFIINKIVMSVDIFSRYISASEDKDYDLISCCCMYLSNCLFDFKDFKKYSFYINLLGRDTEEDLENKINKIFKKLNYIISNCEHDKIIFELQGKDKNILFSRLSKYFRDLAE